MSPPPPLPPPLPPVASKPKSTTPCVLLGCGALGIVGILGIIVVGWFVFTQVFHAGDSDGGSAGGGQASGPSLGFGARLSQYEKAGGSACTVTPDGTWHAVFQERSGYGKPYYIFYRSSRDQGVTWSEPENISNDNTGNGAGYPQMIKDAQGNVYAAWIRFGRGGSAVTDVTLDGPGGYEVGTLTVRKGAGGQWGPPTVMGTPEKVGSFCLFTGANGSAQVLWADEGGVIAQAPAAGGGSVAVAPAGAVRTDSAYQHASGLSALVDRAGNTIFTANRQFENTAQLVIFSGGQVQVLAAEPKYETRNDFNHPARLFADRAGRLHVIYLPSAKLTERTELWDIDPATGQHQVVFKGRTAQEAIQKFQVTAENGVAHVILEWSSSPAIVADSTELVAVSFNGSAWAEPRGLTGNSRAEKFFYKEMPMASDVSLSTRYHAKHASAAMDAGGNVFLLGTIEALSTFGSSSLERWSGRNVKVTSIGNVAEPSVYVIKWH